VDCRVWQLHNVPVASSAKILTNGKRIDLLSPIIRK
jgi:hypothetical protein